MKRSFPIVLVLTATVWFTRGWAAVVTIANDTGPGSLREAITNAIAGETITFAVSGAITLSSGELLIAKCLAAVLPVSMDLRQDQRTAGRPRARLLPARSPRLTIYRRDSRF